MKKWLVIAILLISSITYGKNVKVVTWDIDFDVEASTVEAAPEACVKTDDFGTVTQTTADCEMVVEGADSIYISWNSVDDVLGTHASADWSINVRCIGMAGDSYLTTGTDPTTTEYYEHDVDVDGEYGGFALTPGPYACKIRVDADSAAVAAPSIRVKAEWIIR